MEFRPESGAVLLRIVDVAKGEPLPARATALHRNFAAAKESGLIRLDELPEGPINIAVEADGYETVLMTVKSSEKPREHRVALRPASRVELKIVDGNDEPVPTAKMSVIDATGADSWPWSEDLYEARPILGRRVLRLAAGTYTIRLEAEGYRTTEISLTVPLREVAILRLERK
jgi:hypothetical protein